LWNSGWFQRWGSFSLDAWNSGEWKEGWLPEFGLKVMDPSVHMVEFSHSASAWLLQLGHTLLFQSPQRLLPYAPPFSFCMHFLGLPAIIKDQKQKLIFTGLKTGSPKVLVCTLSLFQVGRCEVCS
jgi:hypothetical protein